MKTNIIMKRKKIEIGVLMYIFASFQTGKNILNKYCKIYLYLKDCYHYYVLCGLFYKIYMSKMLNIYGKKWNRIVFASCYTHLYDHRNITLCVCWCTITVYVNITTSPISRIGFYAFWTKYNILPSNIWIAQI